MRNVYITFYAGNKLIHKLIRWFTKSDINHVAIVYDSYDWETEITIEAADNGVICHSSDRKYKYRFLVTNEYDFCNLKYILSYLGEWYDYVGLVKFGFWILWWKIFKKKLRSPVRDTKGQFCSELVAHYFNEFPGIEIPKPQYTSPDDLLKICEEHPELFLKEDLTKSYLSLKLWT